MSQVIKHKFEVMSVKTSNSKGEKYLGKNGTQAWRVSTKIGNDWWANMVYDEALLPQKGIEYNIELTEEGDWKNWDYKLLTKKEQILAGTSQAPSQSVYSPSNVPSDVNLEDLPFTPRTSPQPPPINLPGRGASYNLAFMMVLKNYDQVNSGNFDKFIIDVEMWGEMIASHQEAFVQKSN